MANEFDLLPTEENRETLGKYLDLQKQLMDVIHKQATVYEKIGHINQDLERRARERYAKEEENLQKNLQETLTVQRETLRLATITNTTERTAMQQAIAAIKDRIELRNQENALIRQAMEFEEQVEKRRDVEQRRWGTFLGNMATQHFKIDKFGMSELGTIRQITSELQKHPYNLREGAGWIAIMVTYLKGAWELFQQFDKAAWDARKALGATRIDMKEIRANAERIAVDFRHIGVTTELAYQSFAALGKEMGSIFSVSKDMAENVSIMSAQLGVSVENSSGFLRNMAAVSKSTMQSQQDMMYIAADMSRSAGVPLNEVMNDISKASSKTLTMMSRMPNVILRTAIEAKRMGTSIDSMAKGSRFLLDFQESVNAEMDASVLLGRSINLQRARELAYRRDLEGSTKEILRITKQIDFENLDVFQQEAFAKATGRSVEELLKMVQAERQWEKARRDPSLTSKVKAYEKMRDANLATQKANAKNYELELRRRANQEYVTAIAAKWSQLMMRLQEKILPVIDKLLGFTLDHFEELLAIGASVLAFGHKFWKVMYETGMVLRSFGGWLGRIQILRPLVPFIGRIGKWMTDIGLKIRSWGQAVTNVLKMFRLDGIFRMFSGLGNKITRFLGGVLGKIIMPVMFAWNIIKNIKKILDDKELMSTKGFWEFNKKLIGKAITAIWNAFSDLFFDIPNLILKGLWAIVSGIGNAIIAGFKWAYNGVKEWLGFSPSGIGLQIVQGIASVAPMVFDALTGPFRKGLAWIADKIPGMGKVADKLRDGFSGMVEPVEKRAAAAYVPVVTVTPQGTQVDGQPQQQPQQAWEKKPETTDNYKMLQSIYDELCQLNKNLESGKIGFYVDGQLLSATLARQTEFRGGYGVNKV